MDPDRTASGLDEDQLEPLISLGDPTRRRLYDFVASAAAPVSRDDASAALGLERSLVAYHLDKLAEEGLLAVSFARPPGRGGPGAGRPAKHYQRAPVELSVSVPARDYRLLADLLAQAIDRDASGAVRRALQEVAADRGRALAGAEGAGAAGGDAPASEAVGGPQRAGGPEGLLRRLRALGFEPYRDGEVVRLRNCPFHQLAQTHTELVCGMNLALLGGLVDALGGGVQARLDPAPERCCVAFDPGGPVGLAEEA